MRIKNLTLALAVAAAFGMASAQTANAPQVLRPNHQQATVFSGLSNNGLYAVGSVKAGEDGSAEEIGAVFFDLTGSTPVATQLYTRTGLFLATDVTDDGRIVTGSNNMQPSICVNEGGKWTWKTLPYPKDKIQINDYTEETPRKKTITINGGRVSAITPDGKYAVGRLGCSDYYLFERAIMWDLTDLDNPKIVDVPNVPEYGRFNPFTWTLDENHQSRFMQVSDDGNYLLGWTNFSFGGEDVVYVIDRKNNEVIYVNYEKLGEGDFIPRIEGYGDIEMDGVTKSMTSDGHYVAAGVYDEKGNCVPFIFDVWNKEFKIVSDDITSDVTAWSVTKEGLVLGATPSSTPYADGLVCTNEFFYTFESLYRDVYGMNLSRYGISNTGKPTLISDDGRTIFFVTDPDAGYLIRLNEDLTEAVKRINLMSGWSVSPSNGSKMAVMQSVTFTFENAIETDAANYSKVQLLDSNGNLVANPLAAGGLTTEGTKLKVQFRSRALNAGEKYTLVLPEGVCWVKGRPTNVNKEIRVSYTGRENVPVVPTSISPKNGSPVSNLDINENPVVVKFDVDVKINGDDNSRPLAHLYIDGEEEALAPLNLDMDLYTNSLVIFPTNTIYLYKGSDYIIKVPQGAVCDLSGNGPCEAFEIRYTGSYVPQLGDDMYLFKSKCDDFTNFLFYEGDHGMPTAEYEAMSFTQDNTPWWVVMDNENSTDMAFASHSCYTDGRQSNDWVTTRQIHMPDDAPAYMTFQGQSYRKNKTDILKIYVYEHTGVLNQLTAATIQDIRDNATLVFDEKLDPGATEGSIDGEWTDYVIDLTPYMGKDIYICFLNENQNQSMVMIDNIYVVKNVDAYITITAGQTVVAKDAAEIKGMLTVMSELADYSSVELTLLDDEGNKVSEVSETGLSLKGGDVYSFAFPQPLPVEIGEVNPYTITYKLDDVTTVYEGSVSNLAFETTKRVVLEEYTGKDCQFCPLGIAAIERLESLYGDKLIPVALHVYNGSDPKGSNMMGYAAQVFQGNTAAPSGRVNRRPGYTQPMYSDKDGNYHMSAADVPGVDNVWQDEVVAEFNEPALFDISVEAKPNAGSSICYTATVKSALNVEDKNLRVLGIVLEDGLLDRQQNGIFNNSDPLLGEFGKGGIYGNATFYYYFNNVARGYWGQSTNGTANLLPTSFEAGSEYTVDIKQSITGIVEKRENVKMAIILIDGDTGRVVNAAVAGADISGVEGVEADEAGISVSRIGSEIVVSGSDDLSAAVYTLDGRQIAGANGSGSLSLSVDGYQGVVIVKAVSGSNSVTKKIIL